MGWLGFDYNIARQPHLIIAERRGPEPCRQAERPIPPGEGDSTARRQLAKGGHTADKPSTAHDFQRLQPLGAPYYAPRITPKSRSNF